MVIREKVASYIVKDFTINCRINFVDEDGVHAKRLASEGKCKFILT